MITERSIVEMADGLSVADLEGEAVILDKNAGRYYGLNTSGARILTLMEKPMKVSAILNRMIELYEIEREQARQDLLVFLEGMLKRRLIKVSDEETI